MRNLLSSLISQAAVLDPKTFVLSGDHGYALFDEIRKTRPNQFINVGVSEQAMIGYASGMMKSGLKTIIYGLSAFLPIRVLEQIKLDLCVDSHPAIMIGDGAGLVYSTLGTSHQCGEDVAALRALPNLQIFSPCDVHELRVCFQEALTSKVPSYIRLGKSDRGEVHTKPLTASGVHSLNTRSTPIALVGAGSMSIIAKNLGEDLQLAAYSVSKIKPFQELGPLKSHQHLLVIEEHSRFGGLFSTLAELIATDVQCHTKVTSFNLEQHFSHNAGTYEYALSEHQMTNVQLKSRISDEIKKIHFNRPS